MTGTITQAPTKSKLARGTLSVPASDIATAVLNAPNATYGIVRGFAIYNSGDMAIVQAFFSASDKITVRVRNVSSYAQSIVVEVYYC